MSTFHIHGYFETLHEIERNKTLGTRVVVPEPGRKMGVEGQIEVVLTAPTALMRGPKQVIFPASPKKPRRCYSTINPICGRMIDPAERAGVESQKSTNQQMKPTDQNGGAS